MEAERFESLLAYCGSSPFSKLFFGHRIGDLPLRENQTYLEEITLSDIENYFCEPLTDDQLNQLSGLRKVKNKQDHTFLYRIAHLNNPEIMEQILKHLTPEQFTRVGIIQDEFGDTFLHAVANRNNHKLLEKSLEKLSSEQVQQLAEIQSYTHKNTFLHLVAERENPELLEKALGKLSGSQILHLAKIKSAKVTLGEGTTRDCYEARTFWDIITDSEDAALLMDKILERFTPDQAFELVQSSNVWSKSSDLMVCSILKINHPELRNSIIGTFTPDQLFDVVTSSDILEKGSPELVGAILEKFQNKNKTGFIRGGFVLLNKLSPPVKIRRRRVQPRCGIYSCEALVEVLGKRAEKEEPISRSLAAAGVSIIRPENTGSYRAVTAINGR
jgi:hypothetical protein